MFMGNPERYTRAGERAHARKLQAEDDTTLTQIAQSWETAGLLYQTIKNAFGISEEDQRARAARTLLNARDTVRTSSNLPESEVPSVAYRLAERVNYSGNSPTDYIIHLLG